MGELIRLKKVMNLPNNIFKEDYTMFNFIYKLLGFSKNDVQLMKIVKSSKYLQDFIWSDSVTNWDLEEWKRMYNDRMTKINNITELDQMSTVDLKKRLIQIATLSISLLDIATNGKIKNGQRPLKDRVIIKNNSEPINKTIDIKDDSIKYATLDSNESTWKAAALPKKYNKDNISEDIKSQVETIIPDDIQKSTLTNVDLKKTQSLNTIDEDRIKENKFAKYERKEVNNKKNGR
jgi:hypothetical protein